MKYFESLSSTAREEFFTKMRNLDQEMTRHEEEHRRLSPRHDEIAVGSAHFDPFLKSYASWEYLTALRKGHAPGKALEIAEAKAREAVQKHNSKRKDINWARDENSAEAYLFRIRRRFCTE